MVKQQFLLGHTHQERSVINSVFLIADAKNSTWSFAVEDYNHLGIPSYIKSFIQLLDTV